MKNEISNREYLETNLNEMIVEMDTADAKLQDKMNTYIIIIPDCTHPYARHDFESDDWRSTNDLFEAWMVDETTADEAAYKFRETFGIDQGSFTISATLLSEAIEDRAAYVLNVLTYSQEAGGIVIKTCDTKATGELIIPATIGGLPVTRIESWAFVGCSGLTRVNIPDSVTHIGDSAFRFCIGLTSVIIPKAVVFIGEGAFLNCTGLKSVTIGNGVVSVGKYALKGCVELTSVVISNSVTSIGYGAFEGCPKVKV